MDWLIVGSVIFFVAAMLLVGIIVSKKVNDADDFFAGGRKTPEFLIVATLLASEVGGGVMIGSVGYGYSLGWGALWYLAPMAIGLVLFGLIMGMELMNTAIESVVDLVTDEWEPLAKRAKDCAAGAVLIASIWAAVAGGTIFFPKLYRFIVELFAA